MNGKALRVSPKGKLIKTSTYALPEISQNRSDN